MGFVESFIHFFMLLEPLLSFRYELLKKVQESQEPSRHMEGCLFLNRTAGPRCSHLLVTEQIFHL